MADEKSNKALKAEAIGKLSESRAEISSDLRWVKHALQPKRVIYRMIERHKAMVVIGGAATVGLATLHLFSRVNSPGPRHTRHERKPTKAGPGLIGILLQASIPLLIKSVVRPGLIQSLIERGHNPSGSSPAGVVAPLHRQQGNLGEALPNAGQAVTG